jgi:AraC family L-rhamnose operon transcriptional activator RhaR
VQTLGEPPSTGSWVQALNGCATSIALGEARVEVMYHGYDARHPDNQLHRHSFFEVCLVGEGTGRFIVGESEHLVKIGDVFIARPGVVHRIVSTSRPEMELYWVGYQLHHIRGPWTDELTALLARFVAAPEIVARDDGRCAVLWRALRVLAGNPHIAGVSEQLTQLTGSLITAIAQLVAPGPIVAANSVRHEAARMHQALRYIDDNLTRSLSPGEVAAHVGLSQRHFTRLFSAHSGCTFHAYLTRARIDRAMARLQHSDESIKAIAADLGFADVHYFARIFTRTVGVPPGQIRRTGSRPGRSIQSVGEFV